MKLEVDGLIHLFSQEVIKGLNNDRVTLDSFYYMEDS